jgi:hypothetical protein
MLDTLDRLYETTAGDASLDKIFWWGAFFQTEKNMCSRKSLPAGTIFGVKDYKNGQGTKLQQASSFMILGP